MEGCLKRITVSETGAKEAYTAARAEFPNFSGNSGGRAFAAGFAMRIKDRILGKKIAVQSDNREDLRDARRDIGQP